MVWPAWVVQAVWFVAATVISIALAPRPPNRKAAALEDFQVPTAEEGRSIPVVFGTVKITGPNVVWYGDLDKQAVRKRSMFSSTVVGYRYYLGLHYVLCYGPVDAFLRWQWDDKTAWSGSRTTSGTEYIDLPKLFGGKNGEGGLQGYFDVMMGEQSQTINTYLNANWTHGATMPAYRGVLSVVWKGGYVGRSQYLKPVSFVVKRAAAGWESGTAWNATDVEVDGGMNPAHLVYQLLTDSTFGYGEPTASIDEANFGEAADTFVAENFGLNIQWVRSEEIGEMLAEVCSHAGMVLNQDPTTGQYVLKLLRGDYVAGDLDLIDEDTVIEMIRYSRQGWGETVNEVTVLYTDPASFNTTGVTVHDLGNIRAQGRVVSQSINFPGIRNHDVAATVAARELAQRSTPLGRGTIRCSRRAWRYQQGDVFRFSWEKEGIVEVVHRVMAIRKGTLEDGSIEIDIAEDIFGIATATYTEQTAIEDIPTPPAEPDSTGTAGGGVLSTTTTAPPGSPADGDSYYIPTGATGEWATHVGEIATWDADEGEWEYETVDGSPVVAVDDDADYQVLDGDGTTSAAPWFVSPTTTKGDLIVRGSSADGRLPVGANGDIPYADSTQPLGIRWAAPPSGGGGGGGEDLDTLTEWFDEGFYRISTSAVPPNAWFRDSSGSGATGTQVLVDGHAGVYRLNSGTTGTSLTRLRFEASGTGDHGQLPPPSSGMKLVIEGLVRHSYVATATQSYQTGIGLRRSTANANALVQIGVRYSSTYSAGVYGVTSRNSSGNAETAEIDPGVIAPTTDWVLLRLEVESTGDWEAFINGASVASGTFTYPPDQLASPYIVLNKDAGTTNVDFDVDFIRIAYEFNPARY